MTDSHTRRIGSRGPVSPAWRPADADGATLLGVGEGASRPQNDSYRYEAWSQAEIGEAGVIRGPWTAAVPVELPL